MDISLPLLVVATNVTAGALSWFAADVRSKARLAYMDEKVIALHDTCTTTALAQGARIMSLEVELAKSAQDRSEMHRVLTRLDDQKASLDLVQALRSEIQLTREAVEKRFDRVEDLLRPPSH